MHRIVLASVLVAGCTGGGAPDGDAPRTFDFGPFDLAPGQELSNVCVSATLNNTEPLFINTVELQTAAGVHHSNWFWVPHESFRGEDGVWPCDSRSFNEPIAAAFGGVLFAQSTQSPHDIQQFPEGAVIPIPPGAKIVAGIHLLNGSDTQLSIPMSLTITPIPRDQVTIQLRPLGIEDQALGLPPHRKSAFTDTCDLAPKHQMQFGKDPDFKIYYILPHYHVLGTGMRLEALDATGGSRTVFDNEQAIGTTLGGPLDPPFDMTGSTQLRMTCNYDNPRDTTVGFGIGDQEMCVLLGFTDSPNQWGGLYDADVGTGVEANTTIEFDHGCNVWTLPKEAL